MPGELCEYAGTEPINTPTNSAERAENRMNTFLPARDLNVDLTSDGACRAALDIKYWRKPGVPDKGALANGRRFYPQMVILCSSLATTISGMGRTPMPSPIRDQHG